ncbi:ABC transporter substrate-binding protein [Streptomyces sp. NPDC002536]
MRPTMLGRLGPVTKAVALAVVLVLTGLGGWAGWTLLQPDPSCGQGVEKRGPRQECTGVTDGAYAFAPLLADVSQRVKEENDRVVGEKDTPYVTVALMISLIGDNEVEQRRILGEVQGAYLAQYRANHLSSGEKPAIRLVLANPGRDGAQWRRVTDQLGGMARSPKDNLRAVTGFDNSTSPFRDAIAHLTRDLGIPVVGGTITADSIANSARNPKAYPGLVRIGATNREEAAAIADFDKDHGAKPADSLLVEDQRQGDNYIDTLKEAFAERTKGSPYQSELFSAGNSLPMDFNRMVLRICETDAKVIYFAGRYQQLGVFLQELGKRACRKKDGKDTAYTVVTGDAANTLASQLAADPGFDWSIFSHGITLKYASLAHPDMWGNPPTGEMSRTFQELSSLMTTATKGSGGRQSVGPISPRSWYDLHDSRTMMIHDSVWTAVSGIRRNTGKDNPLPSLQDVTEAWYRMHGKSGKVEGASGWICLDNYGNPYDKGVAIVELDPRTRSIAFDGLAWPTGRPPSEDCAAPNGG